MKTHFTVIEIHGVGNQTVLYGIGSMGRLLRRLCVRLRFSCTVRRVLWYKGMPMSVRKVDP